MGVSYSAATPLSCGPVHAFVMTKQAAYVLRVAASVGIALGEGQVRWESARVSPI